MTDQNLITPSPEGSLICNDLWQKWLEAFAHLYAKSPRAHRQLDAIYHYFLLDLEDNEIADKLAVSRDQVQVLRARGMTHLRQDTALRTLTHELIENCL